MTGGKKECCTTSDPCGGGEHQEVSNILNDNISRFICTKYIFFCISYALHHSAPPPPHLHKKQAKKKVTFKVEKINKNRNCQIELIREPKARKRCCKTAMDSSSALPAPVT